MKTLKKYIEEEIGFPISLLIKEQKVVPLYGTEDDSYMFGSEIAKKEGVYLAQGDIDSFIENAPKGYFVFGHFGHGINSYGLYYQRVDAWSKIFFRLPFGGVYMDNKKAARDIREFLWNYFDFEKRIRNKVESLIAIDSMAEGNYLVKPKAGEPIKLKVSFLKNPDFMGRFSILFKGDNDELQENNRTE